MYFGKEARNLTQLEKLLYFKNNKENNNSNKIIIMKLKTGSYKL